jgi:hypothetical protein
VTTVPGLFYEVNAGEREREREKLQANESSFLRNSGRYCLLEQTKNY